MFSTILDQILAMAFERYGLVYMAALKKEK
jgi:hypothetical protein